MHGKPLHGKGVWLRRLADCEAGDVERITARAQAAGFTHVILQIADGADPYNVERQTYGDAAAELARHLTAAGIDVWGWHPVYGDKPRFKGAFQPDYHLLEAEEALQRVDELDEAGLCGYVVHAQGDYERAPNRAQKAAQFMETVRAGLRDFPIALASWKNPKAHPRFPWQAFRSFCDLDLPQVFWIGTHGEAARQLEASFRQFAALTPRLPFAPTGPAFFENDWRPAPDDLIEFFETAVALGLRAANLWNWDQLALTGDEPHNRKRLDFTTHWQAVASFVWQEPAAPPFWMHAPEVEEEAPAMEADLIHAAEAVQPPKLEIVAALVIERPPEPAAEVEFAAPAAVEPAPEPAVELEAAPMAEAPEAAEPQPEAPAEPELAAPLTAEAAPATAAPQVIEPELAEMPGPRSRADLPAWLQAELARTDELAQAASTPVEEYAVEYAVEIEPEQDAELPKHLLFLNQPELADEVETFGGAPAPVAEPEPPLFVEAHLVPPVELPTLIGAPTVEEYAVEYAVEIEPEQDAELPEHLRFLSQPEPADEVGEYAVEYAVEVEPEQDAELPEHLRFLNRPELADEIYGAPAPVAEPEPPLFVEADLVPAVELPTLIGAPTVEEYAVEYAVEVEPEQDAELPEHLRFLNQPELADEGEYELEPGFTLDLEPEDDLPEHLQFLNRPELADEIEIAVLLQAELDALEIEEGDLLRISDWVESGAGPISFVVQPEIEFEAEPEPVFYEVELADALELQIEPEDDLPEHLQFLNVPELADAMELAGLAEAEPPPEAPMPEKESMAAPPVEIIAEPPAPPEQLVTMPEWVHLPPEVALAGPEKPPEAALAEILPVTPVPVPDWMTQAEFAHAEQSALASAEAIAAPSPAAELPVAPTELLPDWLAQAEADLTRAAEPLPDWLAEAESDLIRAEETAPASTPEPGLEPEGEALPDWLAQADAELARAGMVESVAAPALEPLVVTEPIPVSPAEQSAAPPQPELAAPVQPIPVPAPAPEPPPLAMPPPAVDDIVGRLFFALRSGQLDEALSLYGPSFALVSADRVVRDPAAVREFYQTLLQRFEGRALSLLSQRGTRAAVSVRWASRRKDGAPVQGADTFHLNRERQIVFHQTTLRTE